MRLCQQSVELAMAVGSSVIFRFEFFWLSYSVYRRNRLVATSLAVRSTKPPTGVKPWRLFLVAANCQESGRQINSSEFDSVGVAESKEWIGAFRMSQEPESTSPQENVVERLRAKIRQARSKGFVVRQEILGEQPSTWCEIGGRKLLFLDAAQSAREQIATLDELLADYQVATSIPSRLDNDSIIDPVDSRFQL
jgi:hypothetical protein